MEIIKIDSKVQNEISQSIQNYNKESYAIRSQIGQKALIYSKILKQAIEIMGETIGDMDKKTEQKDINLSYLANKKAITDDKPLEVNNLDFNKISKKMW